MSTSIDTIDKEQLRLFKELEAEIMKLQKVSELMIEAYRSYATEAYEERVLDPNDIANMQHTSYGIIALVTHTLS